MSAERIGQSFSKSVVTYPTSEDLKKYLSRTFDRWHIPHNYVTIAELTCDMFVENIQVAVKRSESNHPLDMSDEEVVLRADDMLDFVADHFTSMSADPRDLETRTTILQAMEKTFELTMENLVIEEADRKKLLEGYDFRSRIYEGGRYQTNLVTLERVNTRFDGIQLAQYKDPDAEGSIGLAVIVKRNLPKHELPPYRGR